ncbi:winged helix-turn-helix transcriptional regulator [Shewanella dokdonensis]|uniref:Helix-turn-helix transcriptional regulator n=1 Tax=Shewanella dokdonensis TaxID=712036 RepID=A0ABX8DDB9_9GAMM|nr:helix-turn-helix domain-containing protein [Shewanella dokdonensis]MCL1073491.1 helix-turn-helix transcriptional regulator [Shewanella dokdonensis]QVK22720.1 helix-turn-helix transcriptional regulator [Shewanella dokdonensis]
MKQPTPETGLAAQMQRGNLFSDRCPSREVLKHVTSRWGVLVLLALLNGEQQRFSALKRKILGVSEKMLAQTLQQLESDGFVERTVFPVVPPHVEYTLTTSGVLIARQVVGLADWIEENIDHVLKAQQQYQEQQTSGPQHWQS